MAKVLLTSGVSQQFTDGQTEIDIQATTFRQLLRELDELYPGLGRELSIDTAVAIDGEIYQEPFLESISAGSEIYFLPRIGGG